MEIKEPQPSASTAAASIQRLFAFQTVLDGIFERFGDLEDSGFDAAVHHALSSIGHFVGADRAYVIRYDEAAQLTWMTHEWCAEGTAPSFADEQGRSFGEAPRQQARLEAFEVNEIRDVAALAGEWAEDRAYLEGQGISAILEVPLVRRGQLVGVIGLDSMSGSVPWTAEDVTMLRAVATLFAQVSERRVADEDLAVVAEQLRGTVRALHHAEARFAALVDRLPLSVVRVDRDGTLLLRNRAAQVDFVTTSALTAASPASPLADAVADTVVDGKPRQVSFSGDVDGRIGWREASVRPEVDDSGTVESVLVIASDTTERHEHEAQLIRAATHDSLTGLPNRAMLDGLLEHAGAAMGTSLHALAVLFVDLDEFKLVNDSLGHQHGDEVLVAMAGRLRAAVPAGATVARLGGDEYAVLLEDHDEVAAVEVARTLLATIAEPLSVADDEFRTSASIGVAATDDPQFAADLLRWSDVAMYRAKHMGRGRVAVYEDRLSGRMSALLGLDQQLRRAVEHREFRVAYQPVVDLASGSITGAEALVRWQPPDGDPVPAAEFVPLAERNGTILAIGRQVLQDATRTAAGWISSGLVADTFVLAVNLSARQLDDRSCVDEVQAALESSGLRPDQLCLEVTETAALHDMHHAGNVLRAVRQLGVRVAVDDFGTGYGSLQLLQDLPVDRLKLDRSFVDLLPGDRVADAVARAVGELARALGLDLVAEGVETEAQRDALRDLGYGLAQGYLLGRPGFAEEFERLLG